jgi:hypothetical protein
MGGKIVRRKMQGSGRCKISDITEKTQGENCFNFETMAHMSMIALPVTF